MSRFVEITKVGNNYTVDTDAAGPKEEQTKSVTYETNDTYIVTPDEGKVLSSVSVTVDVPTTGATTLYCWRFVGDNQDFYLLTNSATLNENTKVFRGGSEAGSGTATLDLIINNPTYAPSDIYYVFTESGIMYDETGRYSSYPEHYNLYERYSDGDISLV